MKLALVILSGISMTSVEFAHATTVSFGAVPQARTVVDSNLATVSSSGLVWVGTFGSETFTFNPSVSIAGNVTAITAAGAWHQFSLDTASGTTDPGVTSNLGLNGTGKVGGAATDNNGGATKADFFNNKPLYLWIFNASSLAAATEMGIFHATSATQAWNFATNAGGVGDSVTYSTTSAAAPTIAAIGGAGSTSTSQLILAAAVPEPSALALAGLAGLGMLGSRHRHRTFRSASDGARRMAPSA